MSLSRPESLIIRSIAQDEGMRAPGASFSERVGLVSIFVVGPSECETMDCN